MQFRFCLQELNLIISSSNVRWHTVEYTHLSLFQGIGVYYSCRGVLCLAKHAVPRYLIEVVTDLEETKFLVLSCYSLLLNGWFWFVSWVETYVKSLSDWILSRKEGLEGILSWENTNFLKTHWFFLLLLLLLFVYTAYSPFTKRINSYCWNIN